MATITFDTLKFAERLKASGMPDEQAKSIAEAFRDAQQETEVATRGDLKELELSMKKEIKEVELKIADAKADLVRWVVSAGILQTAIIATLVLTLAKG